MNHALASSILFVSTTLVAVGCGEVTPAADSDVGVVQLSLSSVPADAGCLRVTASGGRSLTRLFPLTPGSAPTLTLDRLPAGVVTFDGQAFSGACGSIGASSVPLFVAESPVSLRIFAQSPFR